MDPSRPIVCRRKGRTSITLALPVTPNTQKRTAASNLSSCQAGRVTAHRPHGAASSPHDRGCPLILLGAPSIALLHGLPRLFVCDTLGPLMRWRPVHRLGRICTHPASGWLAASVAVIGWHVPAAFDLALRSHCWHEIEHACFFAAGLLFWWPVIQPWPKCRRIAALVGSSVSFPCDPALRRAFSISCVL